MCLLSGSVSAAFEKTKPSLCPIPCYGRTLACLQGTVGEGTVGRELGVDNPVSSQSRPRINEGF